LAVPNLDNLEQESEMTQLKANDTGLRKNLVTDAGSKFLWDHDSFNGVDDYESWAKVLEDEAQIREHIKAGRIVPISWGVDAASEVVVRLGSPSQMSEREKEYVLVPSQAYSFHTSGRACVSGIEYISGSPTDGVLSFEVEPKAYAVWVVMIAWMDEPGAENEDGTPTDSALPDFIVFLDTADDALEYRIEPEPYRREDAQR
jgi:hypothetical protein